MSADAGLAAEALVAGRGAAALVGPLDFTLGAGEALVVAGPNGVGKSTLLRTLAGLLPALSGGVRLSGLVAADGEPARRLGEAAHYVGHRNAMKGPASVAENLAFWRRFLGPKAGAAGADEAIEAALDRVGLFGLSDLPFAVLSAGQQRRASLARLLIAPRSVWILDEPTTALDAASQRRFAGLVEQHLSQGGMAIAATHQELGLPGARRLDLSPREPEADGLAEAERAAEFWL